MMIGLAGLLPAGTSALAQDLALENTVAKAAAMPLYLAVFINGRDTRLVAEFALQNSQRISSPLSELKALGIKAPDGSGVVVFLDEIPGLTYRYDDQHQILALTADDAALIPTVVSANGKVDLMAPQPSYGAVLNYGLYGTTPDTILDGAFEIGGVSISLDGRLYSPYGVLNSTAAARSASIAMNDASILRYDTYWSYDDQKRMISYTVGDIVSGALPWTRPIRMGGAQVRRDFALREDVITAPLLSASGSAAVPSTIDVYIGNVRAYSGEVEPGPFLLTDVPMINSHGEARIVLRDSSGRETETTVPFFASRNLLRKRIFDFSVEAGLPREDYGLDSFSYGSDPVVSASARYGVTDELTLQGHAEGKPNLLMGGAGFTVALFNRAEVTAAGGGSLYAGDPGLFVYGSLRTELFGVDLNFSSLRSFGDFADLAYATGIDDLGLSAVANNYSYLEPLKALDVLSLGIPLYFDHTQLGLNLIHSERENQEDFIVSASYARSLGWNDMTMHLNAFRNFGDEGGFGAFAGFSMPLGNLGQSTFGVSRDRDGHTLPFAGLSKPMDSEIGSFGYRGNFSGTDTSGTNDAGVSYRSGFGVADMRLRSYDGRVTASGSFDGSLVAAGGGVFAADTVQDSFAVVDAGVPDVPVLLQNRPVTTTGSNGKALVTGLRSYSRNKVSIDVSGLPVDAVVDATDMDVVPARRSGVTVSFNGGIKAAALVVLRDRTGAFIPPGAVVTLNSGREYYVGYDGQVWLEDLEPKNQITAELESGTCVASFGYAPDPGQQVIIDPVECK